MRVLFSPKFGIIKRPEIKLPMIWTKPKNPMMSPIVVSDNPFLDASSGKNTGTGSQGLQPSPEHVWPNLGCIPDGGGKGNPGLISLQD